MVGPALRKAWTQASQYWCSLRHPPPAHPKPPAGLHPFRSDLDLGTGKTQIQLLPLSQKGCVTGPSVFTSLVFIVHSKEGSTRQLPGAEGFI